jgi:hypothetical protein
MNGNEIVEAVEKLHETYPLERVEIWAGYTEQGGEEFTARVGECGRDLMPMQSTCADHPMTAANKLIAKAGVRNLEAALDAKIAGLRAELAKLEARQPAVGDTSSGYQIAEVA